MVLIDNVCSEDFVDMINALFSKSKADIFIIIDKLNSLAEKEQYRNDHKNEDDIIDISDIDFSPDIDKVDFENVISKLPQKHAAMLGLLTQVGRDIADGRCRLALVQEERKKDFMKLMENTLVECAAFLSLDGIFSNHQMCYALIDKPAKLTLEWLETSVHLIDSF